MNDHPFDLAGPVGAHAMVLMHGVTANRRMWLPHTPLLADRYRVIAMDLPGHGALAESPFRLEAAVDLLQRAIRAEAGNKALLVGDSLGGYVSMYFADRHPQLVAGLVLASCSLAVRGAVGVAARIGARLMSLGTFAALGGGGPARKPAARVRRLTALPVTGHLWRASLLVRARPEAFQELAGKDFLSMLRRFPGPVLILNGERDVVFRWGERSFLGAARNARLEIIERAGHTASLERPEVYAAAVHRFASAIGW